MTADATTDFRLTADELTVVMLALRQCSGELEAQMNGAGSYARVTASAWFACALVHSQIAPLLERIETFIRPIEEQSGER